MLRKRTSHPLHSVSLKTTPSCRLCKNRSQSFISSHMLTCSSFKSQTRLFMLAYGWLMKTCLRSSREGIRVILQMLISILEQLTIDRSCAPEWSIYQQNLKRFSIQELIIYDTSVLLSKLWTLVFLLRSS